jgi:hypothetical protein
MNQWQLCSESLWFYKCGVRQGLYVLFEDLLPPAANNLETISAAASTDTTYFC